MQKFNTYKIENLSDESKKMKIKIVNFYNNSVVFEGKYDDIPKFYLSMPMRLFVPYKDVLEFTI